MNEQRQRILDEKLANVLNPKKSTRSVRVTISFRKHMSRQYEKALALARKNRFFMEEGEGDGYRVYASFLPSESRALHELFVAVDGLPETRLFINNKRIPYVQDLWLFLFWFYNV